MLGDKTHEGPTHIYIYTHKYTHKHLYTHINIEILTNSITLWRLEKIFLFLNFVELPKLLITMKPHNQVSVIA